MLRHTPLKVRAGTGAGQCTASKSGPWVRVDAAAWPDHRALVLLQARAFSASVIRRSSRSARWEQLVPSASAPASTTNSSSASAIDDTKAARCAGAGRVVLVDEFRTSRVSSADNTPSVTLPDTPPESFRWLRPVTSMAKRSQVQGPMCSTSINNITRFYDRDVSAALNIRRCAIGPGPRPTELCYWTNRPAMPKSGQPGQDWVIIPDKPLLRKWQRRIQR
ncbi:hypothetical protein QJQ45_009286 [Haematococcus lacustris]|nr:hypothetical protein QJQ45_009286 [Haematococcus lacustris]